MTTSHSSKMTPSAFVSLLVHCTSICGGATGRRTDCGRVCARFPPTRFFFFFFFVGDAVTAAGAAAAAAAATSGDSSAPAGRAGSAGGVFRIGVEEKRRKPDRRVSKE